MTGMERSTVASQTYPLSTLGLLSWFPQRITMVRRRKRMIHFSFSPLRSVLYLPSSHPTQGSFPHDADLYGYTSCRVWGTAKRTRPDVFKASHVHWPEMPNSASLSQQLALHLSNLPHPRLSPLSHPHPLQHCSFCWWVRVLSRLSTRASRRTIFPVTLGL